MLLVYLQRQTFIADLQRGFLITTMPVSASQGDRESRFAHLLKPIRDLSKNWSIDIASELEDYLEQVCNRMQLFHHGSLSEHFRLHGCITACFTMAH